jgi:hypothetical protein
MKTEEIKRMYAKCKLMHTQANQAIKDIDDKGDTLNTQREYQKGLRDAAYTVLNMFTEKEE